MNLGKFEDTLTSAKTYINIVVGLALVYFHQNFDAFRLMPTQGKVMIVIGFFYTAYASYCGHTASNADTQPSPGPCPFCKAAGTFAQAVDPNGQLKYTCTACGKHN